MVWQVCREEKKEGEKKASFAAAPMISSEWNHSIVLGLVLL